MENLLSALQTNPPPEQSLKVFLDQTTPPSLLDVMATARLVASGGEASPFTCGIVNAKSGRCQENCVFCAQSAHHQTEAPVYPLMPDDAILASAEHYADAGVDYFGLVMSGTGPTAEEFDRLCETAFRVASRVPVKLCASLGVLSAEQAVRLKQSGFTSYHHNLETSPGFYARACPSHDFERRAQTVRFAKAAGLRVCCGGLFGLGETWQDRLELSRILTGLNVDSIPINFLNPIPGTPLADMPLLPVSEALAIISVFRLMHPDRDLVVCGGRKTVLDRFDAFVFSAGANGLMIGDYLTVKGSPLSGDHELLEVFDLKRSR